MGSKKPIYVFGQSLKKNNKRKIVTAGRIIAVFLIFGLIANTSLASYVPFIAYNKNARVKTSQTLKSPESKQVMPEMTRPEEKYIEVPSTQDVPREGGNQTVNIEPRELVGKRGSHVEEYLNQDGSITRNVYTSQKYYQKDSQWVEIDNTLVEDTDVADSGVIG